MALMTLKLTRPILFDYISKLYALRFLVIFSGIALVLLALDLLSHGGEVLAGEGAGVGSLWRYTLLRFPQIASELPPFTALLATLITFANLAKNREILVMAGSGLSPFRIVKPMVLTSVVIAGLHFLFNETLVVDANSELDNWKKSDYAVATTAAAAPATNAWIRDGAALIKVGAVTRGGTILDQISIYLRDDEANVVAVTSAAFAAFVDGRWTMFDVKHFSVPDHAMSREPMHDWDTKMAPERFLALAVEPSKVSFVELWRTTRALSAEGQSVDVLHSWLNQKIAGPAESLLMPLLGVLAGFGVLRSGLMFLRIAFGMGLGFSFVVVDNLLMAFGKYGALPPFLAAWAPIILFLLIGLTVLIYAEE